MQQEIDKPILDEPRYALFYGTLRSGEEAGVDKQGECYNYGRLGSTEYLTTFRLKGYKMYSLEAYPCVVKTKDGSGEITVELHQASEEVLNRISRMELGAGYKIETVLLDNMEATMYVYEVAPKAEIIKSGNWLE